MFMVIGRGLAGTTPASAETPANAVAEKTFAPTDLAALKAKMNRRVVVVGRIVAIGESKTGSVRYLNFTKNYRQSVSLVFLTSFKDKGFTKEKLGEYVGKTVRVGGLLSERSGALQIRVLDFEQIRPLP